MSRQEKILRFILSYPQRLFFRGISLRAMVIDSKIDKTARIEHNTNIRYSEIGRYSYVSAGSSVIYAKVGCFCSIASGVAIGGGAHNIDAVSTSPLFNDGKNIFKRNFGHSKFVPYKETIIGNDVWIGNRALILQGITVGDGAIIGAGSVVTKDVEPYTIVAGNPAREIRKRFDHKTIEQLCELKWWDKNEEWLYKYGDHFEKPDILFKQLGK